MSVISFGVFGGGRALSMGHRFVRLEAFPDGLLVGEIFGYQYLLVLH
jgi:hypothetical protein